MDSQQMTGAAGDLAQQGLRYTKDQWDDILGQTEDYVRANPARALGYGVAAGYILNRLPIFRLLSALLRLCLMLFKPAILIYGATKLYQLAKNTD